MAWCRTAQAGVEGKRMTASIRLSMLSSILMAVDVLAGDIENARGSWPGLLWPVAMIKLAHSNQSRCRRHGS